MSAYKIELTPDDNGTFLVTSPAFPEVTSFGETEDEAMRFGTKAVEEAIAARMADGKDLPPPSGWVTRGRYYVHLSAQMAFKISLYGSMRQVGWNRAELARRLGWHRNQVDRLFDLDHASRLDQYEAAFDALGFSLDLADVVKREVEDDAAPAARPLQA